MNTSILSYPGFQSLPKGVKQMLVASEEHFFEQPVSHYSEQKEDGYSRRSVWGPVKKAACEQRVTGELLPCPILHDGSSVLPRWIGWTNKRALCVEAQPAVIAFSPAGAGDGLRESRLA
jgi:hypothetical protein